MIHKIKFSTVKPQKISGAKLKGTAATVASLCIVCTLFFAASGCGRQESSTENNIADDSEIFFGDELCDCKEELHYYSVYRDETEYYHDQFVNNWLFVGFHPQIKDAEIIAFLNKTGFFNPVKRTIERYPEGLVGDVQVELNYATILVNTKEQKTCTQLKEIICELQESHLVAYANLVFWWGEQGLGSFSPYFYVDVGWENNKRNDLFDLYDVAQETNTTVVERPLNEWATTFIVRANKDSKGNALQMSNYFAKTKKFVLTGPHWIFENPKRPERH